MDAKSSLAPRIAARVLPALALLAAAASSAQDGEGAGQAEASACPQDLRYVFSWSMANNCGFAPRGGTSTGAEVTLDPEPHPGWLSLQEEGLDTHERDRRAILAMAGPYRASFNSWKPSATRRTSSARGPTRAGARNTST